jgi:hypothetical protein
VTPEERLAWIVSALESVGLACLVMGGHAVRYYGLQRYTNDFDLTLARDGWDDLADRLARTGLFSGGELVEGNSWRPGAFRRFQLGTLADGQEEWLEFWRENHLLDPFPDLFARREVGAYGTREVPFLALPDLLRSKETERAKDWDDVSYLEEFLDARLHARCVAGAVALADALAGLRSRRGFDTYLAEGSFDDRQAVKTALGRAVNPIAQAFLVARRRHRAARRAEAPRRRACLTAPPVPRRGRPPEVQGLLPGAGPGRQGGHSRGSTAEAAVIPTTAGARAPLQWRSGEVEMVPP